ncbi:MAG: hypothetical protein COA42_04210 [Alteromonadaceae bacterium]|nr:MAG: hypothetical protein COA42_04210 [Alteromonadaceae bacterium]
MTTELKKRCAVEDLSVGMYVTSLDRPVSTIPFPLGGFYIRSKEDLAEIGKHCNHVVVNVKKSQFVRDFRNSLQLEVIDLPKALTAPEGFRAHARSLRPRKVKPRRKGRPWRLCFLLVLSAAVLYYFG